MENTFEVKVTVPRSITVVNTYPVTQEMVDSILITAFEGGINYWCRPGKVCSTDGNPVVLEKGDLDANQWYASADGRWEYRLTDAETGKAYQVGEPVGGVSMEGDLEDGTYRHLNLASLLQGLRLYSEARGFPDETDANVADTIIQLAVFGTCVFG